MAATASWESVGDNWKYKQEDGAYVINAQKQIDGNWYYFDENTIMITNQETPDGYYVNADGIRLQS